MDISEFILEMSGRNQFSHPFRVLLRHLDESDFFIKLVSLQERNLETLKKLHDVCERMCFVDSLVHNLPPLLAGEKTKQFKIQKNRLAVYLSLTCIDVVAGNEYINYSDWLLKKLRENLSHGENGLFDDISKFCKISQPDEMGYALRDWIDTTKNTYLENFGIGRNFQRFIKEDLPDWFEEWLFKIYIFVDIESEGLEWFTQDRKSRIEVIAKYLYKKRNIFTHTVKEIYTKEKDEMYNWRLLDDNNSNGYYEVGTYEQNGKTYIINIREDLTESDIIRIIFVYQCRRKYLLIDDDENFVPEYLKRILYKNLGYLFLRELINNERTIEKWGYGNIDLWAKGYPRQIIFELENRYVEKYFSFPHKPLAGWCLDGSYIEKLNAYMDSMNKVNTRIKILKQGTTPIDETLKELALLSEIGFLYNQIGKIKDELDHRLSDIWY